MPFLLPNQQRQSTEGTTYTIHQYQKNTRAGRRLRLGGHTAAAIDASRTGELTDESMLISSPFLKTNIKRETTRIVMLIIW